MATLQNALSPLVFGPEKIAKVSAAYDAALNSITEENDFRGALTGREIRKQVASLILAEARTGEFDRERLVKAALQGLDRPYAELDE